MTIGERIEERRKALNIPSQSALARMVDMRQSTLNGLIRKPYRWSPYLPALARALQTSVEYLVGDTDDAAIDVAVQPSSPPVRIVMEVQLPSEQALFIMFRALLKGIDPTSSQDEQALLLAQRLPIGLAQLQDVRPDRAAVGTVSPRQKSDASHAKPHLEPQR